MKMTFGLVWIIIVCMCCENDLTRETITNPLLGKWSHAYKQKTKLSDGTWSEWQTIYTLVALPTLEFSNDGQILWNGKQSSDCCQFKKYTINGNTIELSDMVSCPTVKCALCQNWQFSIDKEDLILETCSTMHLYKKLK